MQPRLPSFTPKAVEALAALGDILLANPEALNSDKCNYSPQLRMAISSMLLAGASLNSEQEKEARTLSQEKDNFDVFEDENLAIDIESESRTLYRNMKKTMVSIDKMETGEKVQMFRVATSLLEKLLSLEEKSVGVAHFKDFKQYIINSMERYLTPVQKTEFLDDMKSILDKD